MKLNTLFSFRRLLPLGLLLLVLVGLYFVLPPSKNRAQSAEPAPKAKNKAVVVTTAKVQLAPVPITVEAIGNVEALESVSVQPQISGLLKKVFFSQGAFVHKGQLLFEIDSRLQSASIALIEAQIARSQATIRQAKANLAKSSTLIVVAEANLKRDQAQQKFAALEVERYKQLLDKSYVALEQYQMYQNTLISAEATLVADQAAIANARAQVQAEQAALQTALSSLKADQASLASARIQMGFSKIYAPISGKTGPILINAGNNVQANNSALVNIKRLSPIAVSFSVPEKHLADFQKAFRQTGVPVKARLKGDSAVIGLGRLVFVDNTINKNNGTVVLKASFENADADLWPGLYVNISAELGIQKNALKIPATAIQKGPQGDFVYTVVKQKAQLKPVVVDRIVQGTAIIAQGLKAEQEVIVTGQMALAPGASVKIEGQESAKKTGQKR
jgi:membrane fusion protein, multidrug efflux system